LGLYLIFFYPYIYIYIFLIIISSKCALFSLPWKIQFSTFINARYNIQCVHTFYKCGALRQYFRTILKPNRNIVERCEIGTSSFWYGFNRVFIGVFFFVLCLCFSISGLSFLIAPSVFCTIYLLPNRGNGVG
jgi:hypothetical protein